MRLTRGIVQMATVRANGRPANRTLVFRGFLHDSPRLTFVTDERSAKVGDLERLPWAEICWYFPVTHEQFRITGPTTLVRDATGEPALQLTPGAIPGASWPRRCA